MATTETTTAQPAEGETTTHTEVPGGEHEGGHKFPPLDSTTYASQILWLVVFFSLLYLLMSKFVLPKVGNVLDMRAKHISDELAKAKSLQEQTSAAVQAYEKALAEARAEAQGIAQQTRAKLTSEVDAERASLDADLAKKITSAENRIANSKAKAMADVKTMAADAAASIVEQLTGAKISKTAAAKAVSGKA